MAGVTHPPTNLSSGRHQTPSRLMKSFITEVLTPMNVNR